MLSKIPAISPTSRLSSFESCVPSACSRFAADQSRSPIRSRSIINLRHASSSRASASLTAVMAPVMLSSTVRSMRSSSFSQSLTARKAIFDESRVYSRTLNAESLATRQACRIRSVIFRMDSACFGDTRFMDSQHVRCVRGRRRRHGRISCSRRPAFYHRDPVRTRECSRG